MANQDHVNRLAQGRDAWNQWRRDNRTIVPDLSGGGLAFFVNGRLAGTTVDLLRLPTSELAGYNLARADLSQCDLSRANLRNAMLFQADLTRTDLSGAALVSANLVGAKMLGTQLAGANLDSAQMGGTVLAGVDLSATESLERVEHGAASILDFQTLYTSHGRLPLVFLRGCGLPEHVIQYLPSLMQPAALQFFACFISYSHSDKIFAHRLLTQLQSRDIRCWLDEKKLKPGDRILDIVDTAIRTHDKLLLCCSRASLTSWWVKDEIRKAQERERKENGLVIIPLNIDGYIFSWEDGLASDIRSRLAADFTGWEADNGKFDGQLERVMEALRP